MIPYGLDHGINIHIYGRHVDTIGKGIISDGIQTISQGNTLQIATAIKGIISHTAQFRAHNQMNHIPGLCPSKHPLFRLLDHSADSPCAAVAPGSGHQVLVADIADLSRLYGLIIGYTGICVIPRCVQIIIFIDTEAFPFSAIVIITGQIRRVINLFRYINRIPILIAPYISVFIQRKLACTSGDQLSGGIADRSLLLIKKEITVFADGTITGGCAQIIRIFLICIHLIRDR